MHIRICLTLLKHSGNYVHYLFEQRLTPTFFLQLAYMGFL